MKRIASILAAIIGTMGLATAYGQDLNPALNSPDEISWQLFMMVTPSVPGTNNVVFETWASNEDTFQADPIFPGATAGPDCTIPTPVPVPPTASPKILNIPALVRLIPNEPGLQPHVLPGGSEETRRNQATFDFIVCHNLQTTAGLRQAFTAGTPISFPSDAVEVKAEWADVAGLDQSRYYVNTASDGKTYALVGFHIISKMIPNWTWATFEHEENPGRCDFIGCHDNFGALVRNVSANPSTGGSYSPCVKTDAVKKLFADAGLPDFWQHYCLKGSQVDFTTATGVPTLLGNSAIEGNFANTSSCMSCHARAAVKPNGLPAFGGGFINASTFAALCPTGSPCSPNGAPVPSWFWSNLGLPDQTMLALQTDFVFSIPLAAVDP